MNKVIIVGTVDSVFPGEKHIKFKVKTTEKWKDKEGEGKSTDSWHSVIAFGITSDILKASVKVGSTVCVEGKLKNSSYEKDGVKHYSTDVNANSVEIIAGADFSV